MTQIEATIEALRDRSTDAVGAVQHGVDALASKLTDLIEPEPKRSKSPWLGWLVMVAGLAAVVIVVSRRRRGRDSGSADATAWNDLAEETPKHEMRSRRARSA
jgi:hypothetical protein